MPSGQEMVVRRMLDPSGGLPSGWRFARSRAGEREIRALYQNLDEGLVATLILVHRGSPGRGARLTERFAASLQATHAAPSAGALFTALVDSIRAAEADFRWERVAPRAPSGSAAAPSSADATAPSSSAAAVPAPSSAVHSPPRAAAVATAAPSPGPARWGEPPPADPRAEREIDEHLELVPWIDLQLDFDHRGCFEEALALADRFVVYRSDERYEVTGWHGLALRALDGDPTKAAVAEGEAANQLERYAMTDVAARCPRTMALLDRVLDWDRSRAVAFLMMTARSRIEPHCDDTCHEVMRSLNVALNMPAGCDFWIETNADGSHNPFTRRAPFQPGTALLMNVARQHYLVNPTEEPRIHIVARGPVTLPAARLVELARRQNGIDSEQSLWRALDEKYRQRGLPARPLDDPSRYVRKPRLVPPTAP